MHRLHPTLLWIGVLGAHFGWQPTPDRSQVGQDTGRLPLERRLLSFPAMELLPLPLSLFNLFAESGRLFLFRHDFPSDYSLGVCLPGLYPSRRAANQKQAAAKTVAHQNHSPKRVNQVVREE